MLNLWRLLRVSGVVVAGLLLLAVSEGAEAGKGSQLGVPGASEESVTFTSDGVTIYGSLLLPPAVPGARLPAALILAGSGPTDRNGNSALICDGAPVINTLFNFANAFAGEGVASLRYDKLGTGQTGLPSTISLDAIGFDLFVNEARAAYDYLRSRPEIDPNRIIVLGHSEGALIALVLATELAPAEQPAALVLAAGPGFRYLTIIRQQLDAQLRAAVQAGQLSQALVDSVYADLDRTIAELRENGRLPETTTPGIPPALQMALRSLFNPSTARFLAQADRYDPPALAAALPPTMSALILRGEKDQQVSAADARQLAEGFRAAGNAGAVAHELPNVDHVFKVVLGAPNPGVDYCNPDLPFSQAAATHLTDFLRGHLSVTRASE